MQADEKTLSREMAKGSKKAFSNAYKLYFTHLCCFAYRYFHNEDEAYEIVQQTFLKIWEQRKKLENVDSLKSYLYKSVRNACINRMDHLKVVHKHHTKEWLQLKDIELENFEDRPDDHEMRKLLASVIAELPPKNRKVLELRYYENRRYKEISKQLNISERTVEAHLRNSIQEIRNKLLNTYKKDMG